MADEFFNLENLVGQEIPPEIVDQIKVLGRVRFPLKDTTASAVSTSGQEPDDATTEDNANLSGVLDHVAEMESLTEQMEDMIDQLLKDMKIPVSDDTPALKDAVRTLGGDDVIDKDILDKALSIIDHAPYMILGQDPILAALTGNGKLEGPYMDCDEITRGVAEAWNTADPKNETPEATLKDATTDITEQFEKNKNNMLLEILLMLWWNMIWPKFIVSLVIVNPLRVVIAYPLDGIITFFKSMVPECGKTIFRKKSKECLKNYGPINKALNRLACFLLCKVPPPLYKRYKPMVEPKEFMILKKGKLVPCDCNDIDDCPPAPDDKGDFKKDGDFSELGKLMDSLDEPCASVEDFLDGVDTSVPEGLGINPNCLKAAQIILEAVVADALTPSDPSKIGITGAVSVSAILEEQNR